MTKKEYDRIRYLRIRVAKLAYQKIYYEENSEKISEYRKQYYEDNKEAEQEKHKEYINSEKGKLVKFNSESIRRAIINASHIPTEQISKLKLTFTECFWCNCSVDGSNTHLDHFIPLSKGGEHVIDNLVISCAKCNINKKAIDPYDYAISIGLTIEEVSIKLQKYKEIYAPRF